MSAARGLMLAAAVLAAAGCASLPAARTLPPPSSSPPAALLRVHDPGHVTGTVTGPCYARNGGLLPDPRCTPGAIDPAVTQDNIGSTICRAGYTRTVRPPASQTSRFKFQVAYPAYGLPAGTLSKLDHEIPEETGGANDAANLWPETPPGDRRKDRVEDALHAAVCSGKITLAAAQIAIARNWITAEHDLGLAP